MPSDPGGRGPKLTILATWSYAFAPSNPPVCEAGGADSAGFAAAAPFWLAGGCDVVAALADASERAPSWLAAATLIAAISTPANTNLRHVFGIYCASPVAMFAACFRLNTTYETNTPRKYSKIIGAMNTSIVVASGVGVMIAAATVIITIAYLKFFSKNFGVTIPNSERIKIRTGSSNTRPSPSRIIKVKSKYSLMLISGLIGPSFANPIRNFSVVGSMMK